MDLCEPAWWGGRGGRTLAAPFARAYRGSNAARRRLFARKNKAARSPLCEAGGTHRRAPAGAAGALAALAAGASAWRRGRRDAGPSVAGALFVRRLRRLRQGSSPEWGGGGAAQMTLGLIAYATPSANRLHPARRGADSRWRKREMAIGAGEYFDFGYVLVGVAGFEPATSSSRTRCVGVPPHPDDRTISRSRYPKLAARKRHRRWLFDHCEAPLIRFFCAMMRPPILMPPALASSETWRGRSRRTKSSCQI